MKEYGQMKSKRQEEEEKWRDHMIDKGSDYICTIPSCSKIWYPTIELDTNRKRPSTFYKLCRECRTKSYLKGLEYKAKKGNNYDKLRDGEKMI